MLWTVIGIGISLRFLPGLQTDFPLNDGGMFLSMIRDLRANHFLLPAITSYNVSNIPYAYPPFGMFAAALLSTVFSIPEISVLHWLPAIASAAIVPVFYWLSLQIFDSKTKAFIAAALYAVTPNVFDWLVMGGGLTRSFGILFSLLAFGHVYRMFRSMGKVDIWWSILFCALAVLSHPEVGLQTAVVCSLFWLMDGRNNTGVKQAAYVALGTALLTAPWWLTVLLQHGVAPFESAMQTGIRETLLASLFHSIFSTQGGLPILPILTLTGIFTTLRRKEFLLTAWALLPFVADPRNAPAIATFPLILLSSEGLVFLKDEFERAYAKTMTRARRSAVSPSFWMNGIFTILLGYFLFLSTTSTGNLPKVSLKPHDRETMTWIKGNLPSDSRFLLITNVGQISPMGDAYQEWFPALTERRSMNTLQGREWTLGPDFYAYSQRLIALQTCLDAACIHDWMENEQVQIDYLLILKKRASRDLVLSIQKSGRYKTIYESQDTLIFEGGH